MARQRLFVDIVARIVLIALVGRRCSQGEDSLIDGLYSTGSIRPSEFFSIFLRLCAPIDISCSLLLSFLSVDVSSLHIYYVQTPSWTFKPRITFSFGFALIRSNSTPRLGNISQRMADIVGSSPKLSQADDCSCCGVGFSFLLASAGNFSLWKGPKGRLFSCDSSSPTRLLQLSVAVSAVALSIHRTNPQLSLLSWFSMTSSLPYEKCRFYMKKKDS